MKKLVLVLAILALGSFASATTLGFYNYTGTLLYCNYEIVNSASSFGATAIQVQDNLSVGCFGGAGGNATGAGASGKGTFIDVSNGTGKKAKVNGWLYGDNLYDAFSSYACGCAVFTGAQWFVASNKVADASLTGTKYGWYGLASSGGTAFGNNFGHLSNTIPGKGNVASHGTNAGKFTK